MKPADLRALFHGGMASVLFVGLATIGAELSVPFKDLLAASFGHHWIGKGVLSLLVFGGVYLFQRSRVRSGKPDMVRLARKMAFATILAGTAIFVFYLIEWFKG